ncbi:MAG: hypothetical protein LC803_21325 [Acidobacteria bacterium]|nr:hypothetical protein [Acidobacteriota bacterium]
MLFLCILLTALPALTTYAQATGAGGKVTAKESGKKQTLAFVERQEGVNKSYRMAFSYYTLREQMTAALTLNNKGPYPVEIRPVLYSLAGERLEVPPVTVAPTSHRVVNLAEWASPGGSSFLEGSIQFIYEGKDLEVGGQVRLMDADRSLIFEEQVTRLDSAFVSSQLEGVWWLPSDDDEIRLVLSNTTDSMLDVTVNVAGLMPKPRSLVSLNLAPHETRVSDLAALAGGTKGKLKEVGGISVTHSGSPGALVARALVRDAARGFSTFVEFIDPMKYRSTKLHGAGLRLGRAGSDEVSPVVVARNLGNSVVTLTGRVPYTASDGTTSAVTLRPIRIAAGEIKSLDLHSLSRDGGFGMEVASAGLEFEHTGSPGGVIMSALSVGRGGDQVFRVPLLDPAAQRSSTGAYPWRIEGNSSTFVYVKNTTAEAQQYVSYLKFKGITYMIGMKTVEPGQTAVIDVRRLRDEQVPDEGGQTIPRETESGQVIFSLMIEDGTPPLALIGRAEQADTVKGMSSSYACQSCCNNGYWDSFLSADAVDADVDMAFDFDSYQIDIDCYGNLNTFLRDTSSWSSSDSSIVSVDSSGVASMVGAGVADITASWTAYRTGESLYPCEPEVYRTQPDGGDAYRPACGTCSTFGAQARPGGSVTSRPRPSGATNVWWFNGETPAGYATTITLTASPTGAPAYNWAVVSGADKVTVSPSGNTISVTGANASAFQEVGVQVTVNGVSSRPFKLSVRAPHRLVLNSNFDHSAHGTLGYLTRIHYRIEDQFTDLLPTSVGINEQFTTGVINDYPGTNWVRGPEGGATVSPVDWADAITGQDMSTSIPPSTAPCSPLCSTRVHHFNGGWFVGSEVVGRGRRVQTNTWQRFTDHAEHTNRVSPAP